MNKKNWSQLKLFNKDNSVTLEPIAAAINKTTRQNN